MQKDGESVWDGEGKSGGAVWAVTAVFAEAFRKNEPWHAARGPEYINPDTQLHPVKNSFQMKYSASKENDSTEQSMKCSFPSFS